MIRLAHLGAALVIACTAPLPVERSSAPSPTERSANTIRAIRTVASTGPFREAGVEIELQSSRLFPARNELAVLRIGTRTFLRSRYPDSGDLHALILFLTSAEFAALTSGDPVTVGYGVGGGGDRWDFGPLDKGRLDRP